MHWLKLKEIGMMFGSKTVPISTIHKTSKNTSSTIRYIRFHLKIMAILCLLPYYLKYDELQRAYRLHRNTCHTVLCMLTSSFLVIQGVKHIQEIVGIISAQRNDPFSYFIIAEALSETSYFLSVLVTVWLKSDHLAHIIAFTQNTSYSCDNVSIPAAKKRLLWLIYVLTAGPIPMAIVLLTDGIESAWKPSQLFANYYSEALRILYLNPDAFPPSNAVIYIFVVILQMCIRIGGTLLSSGSDWLVVTYSLLMYHNLEEYTQVVRNPESTTSEIRRRYEDLKMISKLFNNWLGMVTFMLTLGSFPFFVSKFYEIVQPTNAGRFLLSVFNLWILLSLLFLGAVIDKKAKVTKEWVSNPKHNASMSSHELQVLLNEVQDCEIGIYGLGLFKFTSGLLGSVISLLVTFAIIMLQFKETVNSV